MRKKKTLRERVARIVCKAHCKYPICSCDRCRSAWGTKICNYETLAKRIIAIVRRWDREKNK